jgi:hypothetical protein
MADRGIDTLRDKPWTLDWADWAVEVFRHQPVKRPIDWVYWILEFGSRQHREAIDSCTNPVLVTKAEEMQTIRRRSPQQADAQLGGARRLFKPLIHPLFVATAQAEPKFDLMQALIDKTQILVNGKGLARDTFRFFANLLQLECINAVRRHYDKTGQTLPTVLVLEESGAYGLITEFTIRCAQEQRKMGGPFIKALSQSPLDWKGTDIFARFAANCPRKLVYRNDTPEACKILGEILATPTFDSKEVHYTRERLQHDGYEEIETTSHSRSKNANIRDHKSKTHGDTESVSHGTASRAKYKPVTDEFYKSVQTHLAEFQAGIANNKVGQRHRRDFDGVTRETVTMLEAPWVLGHVMIPVKGMEDENLFPEGRVSRHVYQLRRAIHRIRSRPHYQLCNSSSSSPSEPTRIPDPPTGGGVSVIRGL